MNYLEELVEYTSSQVDFCDVRYEFIDELSVRVENGLVGEIRSTNKSGVVIRAMVNGTWGYASTSYTDWYHLKEAANKAIKTAKKLANFFSHKKIEIKSRLIKGRLGIPVKINPKSVDIRSKIEDITAINKIQKDFSPKIINAATFYKEQVSTNILSNSLGSLIEWHEIRTSLFGYSVARSNGKMQNSFFSERKTAGYELVTNRKIEEMSMNTSKEAIMLLNARKPPSGYITVIADPSVSGVLAHVTIGHASEADEVLSNRGFTINMLGVKIGSLKVTVVDDGTIKGAYGTIPFDNEGTFPARTVIVDHGYLNKFLQNLTTASLMNQKPTGNGRAQDFSKKVLVRMTNTFIQKGQQSLEEIIESTNNGVLALKAISGTADPAGKSFETKVLYGYVINNGQISNLLRSFSLSGKITEILRSVDMISKDFKLIGRSCGKGLGNFVPVSIGGPYLRAKMLVGG